MTNSNIGLHSETLFFLRIVLDWNHLRWHLELGRGTDQCKPKSERQ
jgi:hypothetical protein